VALCLPLFLTGEFIGKIIKPIKTKMELIDKDFQNGRTRHHGHFDQRSHANARRSWGVILVLLAMVIFLRIFDILPYGIWHAIISWEMLLVAIGLLSLINNRSVVPGIILIALGLYFGAMHYLDLPYYFKQIFWPSLILLVGVYLIVAPPRYFRSIKRSSKVGEERDFIDEVSVFGGGDRIVTSQNFKGGRLLSIFGGSKINLMNAKLADGPQIIDTLSVFGGSTLVVPAGWTVRVEVVAVFGGFNDKRERLHNIVYDQHTMLVVKGLAIFGGGEVKSFGL